ncbi:MAG: hypothetical protein JXO22_13905 [Phycisphaerae bacterium]|nr:hypothetical protein [Phycisphaerae bacterium]
MTYQGRVKNGVVVLEADARLPDGTLVRIEPIDERPLMNLVRLTADLEGAADWPADGAAEHDHYLYGTPKTGR